MRKQAVVKSNGKLDEPSKQRKIWGPTRTSSVNGVWERGTNRVTIRCGKELLGTDANGHPWSQISERPSSLANDSTTNGVHSLPLATQEEAELAASWPLQRSLRDHNQAKPLMLAVRHKKNFKGRKRVRCRYHHSDDSTASSVTHSWAATESGSNQKWCLDTPSTVCYPHRLSAIRSERVNMVVGEAFCSSRLVRVFPWTSFFSRNSPSLVISASSSPPTLSFVLSIFSPSHNCHSRFFTHCLDDKACFASLSHNLSPAILRSLVLRTPRSFFHTKPSTFPLDGQRRSLACTHLVSSYTLLPNSFAISHDLSTCVLELSSPFSQSLLPL